MRVVHSWFLDTFGEANRKTETKLNSRKAGKNTSRISMSNINLQKCLSQKYVAKQKNADILLHHYYYTRVFSVWKKEYRAYKSLKTKINAKVLSHVLTFWQRYSRMSKIRNQKVKLILGKHQ